MTTSAGRRERAPRSLHAPEGQAVTFVELFFDLVFVFAVTQVTAETAHHLDLQGVARGVLVFWLIWWAWTQFTWTLNPADTRHVAVQVMTLVATTAAFIMASSVSLAFTDGALWFALPYVVVRVLGMGLQVRIAVDARAEGGSSAQVSTWVALSSLGLVAVLVGAVVGTPARGWIWVLAIVLDLVSALIASRSDQPWDLSPSHLAERHGLFVIIAIGESLIVAGSAAVGESRSPEFIALAGAGLAVVGLLWWSYFAWFKDDLEEAFAAFDPGERGRVASVAYSLAHFPLVGGIVAFAVAAELMVTHPTAPVEGATIAALAMGIVLYMGATVFAYRRVHHRMLGPRLAVTLATAAGLAFLVGARPVWPLAVAAVGLAVIAAVERDRLPHRTGHADATLGDA